jgi:hypothetical protein
VNRTVPNPKVGMMNRQAEILTRCAETLGFTPTARPRLIGAGHAAPRELDADGNPTQTLDEFLAQWPAQPSFAHIREAEARPRPRRAKIN